MRAGRARALPPRAPRANLHSRATSGLRSGVAFSSSTRLKGVAMPERDGYTAGVPCWTDTTQPDPEAAARFYGGLFGWECEDVMPPDAPGTYLMARIRGRDVAAVSPAPERAPTMVNWNTYIQTD